MFSTRAALPPLTNLIVRCRHSAAMTLATRLGNSVARPLIQPPQFAAANGGRCIISGTSSSYIASEPTSLFSRLSTVSIVSPVPCLQTRAASNGNV